MPLKEKKKHTKTLEQPLVSIITPLYNAANYIAKTILSIQQQSHTNWELLIVDDYSTDNGLEIAKSIAKTDSRIHIYSQKSNQGAAVCRNKATEVARGDYIAFLDADDLWLSSKLEKQLNAMKTANNPVCYSSYVQIDASGQLLGKRIKALPELSYKKERSNNYLGNLTGIYNCAVLGKIIAPNIRKRQDWAVWLMAIEKSGKPALGIQEDLAYYRVHDGNMSSNKWKLVNYNYKFYRTFLGYSVLKSLWFLLLFFREYFVERPKLIERY